MNVTNIHNLKTLFSNFHVSTKLKLCRKQSISCLSSSNIKMLNYNPTSFYIKARPISYQSKRRNKSSTCLLHKQKRS